MTPSTAAAIDTAYAGKSCKEVGGAVQRIDHPHEPPVTTSGLSSSPMIRLPGSAASSTSAIIRSAARSTSVTKSRLPLAVQPAGSAGRSTARRYPAARPAAVLARCSKSKEDTVLHAPVEPGKLPAMPRIFSGIQPSGELHIGNWLGAVQNWVNLQLSYDCIYCVVDLHAITGKYDQATLAQRTREMAIGLLASGIDPVARGPFRAVPRAATRRAPVAAHHADPDRRAREDDAVQR